MDPQPLVIFDKAHSLQPSHGAIYVGAARTDHLAQQLLRYPGKCHFVILVLDPKLRQKEVRESAVFRCCRKVDQRLVVR